MQQHRLLRAKRKAHDRAARRVHDRLLASPPRLAGPPRRPGLALTLLVFAGFAAYLVLTVVVGLELGPLAIGVLGSLGLVALWFPRWSLPEVVGWLGPADDTDLFAATAQAAEAVGAPMPDHLGYDSEFSLRVHETGLIRRRSFLVIGLGRWTAQTPAQNAADLAHALAHVRGTWWRRLCGIGEGYLDRWYGLLVPFEEDPRRNEETDTPIYRVARAVGRYPLALGALLLDTATARGRQRWEFALDEQAARLVGHEAVASGLAIDPRVLIRELTEDLQWHPDAFGHLLARPRTDLQDAQALIAQPPVEPWRAGDDHPPEALRISLLLAHATPAADAERAARLTIQLERATERLANDAVLRSPNLREAVERANPRLWVRE